MLGHLTQAGHAIVPDGQARVVMVNTCGFIDRAKEESVEAILEQVERKKRGEIDRVIVAGCMVQKYGRELAGEIPEVDCFIGLDELGARARGGGRPALAAAVHRTSRSRRGSTTKRAPRPLAAAAATRTSRSARVRQPLHVLHDPADARPPAQPHDRSRSSPRRRRSRRRASPSSS